MPQFLVFFAVRAHDFSVHEHLVFRVLAVSISQSFSLQSCTNLLGGFRMLSRLAYDNKGNEYNVSRVLTPEATLDLAAYQDYSPLFLP